MIAVSIPNQQFFTMYNFSAWLIIQLVAILKQYKILFFAVSRTVNKLHPVFWFPLSINVIGEASILFEYLKCSRKKANVGTYQLIVDVNFVLYYNMQALVVMLFTKIPVFIKRNWQSQLSQIVKFGVIFANLNTVISLDASAKYFLIGVHICPRYQKTNSNIQKRCQHFV